MIATTTPTIEGHTITKYYGVVTSEVIIGANFIKDLVASFHDVFGGRSRDYEQVLAEAKGSAMLELQQRAGQLGANAVVGIDFDYETIGQSASMLMVACSGTAVTID